MERKKTILDYIGHIFIIFGFTMVCMMCFTFLFGETAQEYSTFFRLGKEGVSSEVMAQFFLLSILVTLWNCLYESGTLLKFLPGRIRSVSMILSVFLTVVVFVVVFQWFPVNMWQPWAMFFLCFALCVVGSTTIFIAKTKTENRKLEEGLNKLKEKWEKEEKDE
ncbi:hypothetical protein [Konateibacter massiliensis]|uniref:hypothetical protein n=1 Tax=Konateibacter massiliensis TaxID=2002841 RepID=UPI000C147613|nr:hypothetical protein [Konateibacter massiliensis]